MQNSQDIIGVAKENLAKFEEMQKYGWSDSLMSEIAAAFPVVANALLDQEAKLKAAEAEILQLKDDIGSLESSFHDGMQAAFEAGSRGPR